MEKKMAKSSGRVESGIAGLFQALKGTLPGIIQAQREERDKSCVPTLKMSDKLNAVSTSSQFKQLAAPSLCATQQVFFL